MFVAAERHQCAGRWSARGSLVVAELGGRLDIGPHDGGGTLVRVELPIELLPAGRATPGPADDHA